LGRAASGASSVITKAESVDEEIDEAVPSAVESQPPHRLTIAEAKAALAESFGVPIENIQIVIKG
jgi:hypothetical protein